MMMLARPMAQFSTDLSALETVLVDKKDDGTALVTLNRPKALNALCYALYEDLNTALTTLDKDPEVKAIVLTGS